MYREFCVVTKGAVRFSCVGFGWRTFYFGRKIMNVYRVALIGHREISHFSLLEKRLEYAMEDLIQKNDFVEFYIGRNGEFDILAASVFTRMRERLGKERCAMILVLPYPVADQPYYEKYYDEVILPLPKDIHRKAAIEMRNRWMVDHTDLLLSWVEHRGGAFALTQYARKTNQPVWDLTREHI